MENNEYVAVAVLCFNSSKTVIDTLESIKSQRYKYLDLIINDDCSTDNTVSIINEWVKKNSQRFRYVKIMTREMNQGINKSFDSVIRACNTKWIKFIAADDMLLEGCIEKNVEYIHKEGIDSLVYSLHYPFMTIDNNIVKTKEDPYEVYYLKKIGSYDSKEQYKRLLKKDIVFSSTGFINKQKYIELGGITLEIRNIEDWPLRLLFTKNGEKIYVMEEYTTLYRIGDSVSHAHGCFFNTNHIDQRRILKEQLIYPNISRADLSFYYVEIVNKFRVWVIIHLFKNQKNSLTIAINRVLMLFDISKWSKGVYSIIYAGRKLCR